MSTKRSLAVVLWLVLVLCGGMAGAQAASNVVLSIDAAPALRKASR